MSFTFRTIPLDCLALTCQYLTEMCDHCAIHSTSRHWRRILIAADEKYSHAYASVAHSVNIRWLTRGFYGSRDEANRLQERRQLDLAKFAGIQLSFAHLQSLSVTFNIQSDTKKMQKQVDKLRSSFYALLSSLSDIQHLSINDTSQPFVNSSDPDDMQLLFPYDNLARVLNRITTLRTFEYEIRWISDWIGNRLRYPNASRPLPLLSDSLISALTKSSRLSKISGGALVQSLSYDQWLKLLSSLSYLKCLGSIELVTCDQLHSIVTRPLPLSSQSSNQRLQVARSQIRSLDCIETNNVYPIAHRTTEWIRLLTEMGCSHVRLKEDLPHLVSQGNAQRYLIVLSELLTNNEEPHALRTLTLDFPSERLNEYNLHSNLLAQVHQLELTHHCIEDRCVNISLFTNLPSLKCLILRVHTITQAKLREILTAASALLELQLLDINMYERVSQGAQPTTKETTRQIARVIQSHPKLHLLRSERIFLSQCYIGCKELAAASTKCARMLEYANQLSWIDLVTLPRDEIKKRIAGSAPSSNIP